MLKCKRTNENIDFYQVALKFKSKLSKPLNVLCSESSESELVYFQSTQLFFLLLINNLI